MTVFIECLNVSHLVTNRKRILELFFNAFHFFLCRFSVSNDLKYDAERDLRDIGAKNIQVHSLNKVLKVSEPERLHVFMC